MRQDNEYPELEGGAFAENLERRNEPMLAVLQAFSDTREGRWVRGAPTHVLAEFLTNLEKRGWEVVRKNEK